MDGKIKFSFGIANDGPSWFDYAHHEVADIQHLENYKNFTLG
jgi:hypothetical protein